MVYTLPTMAFLSFFMRKHCSQCKKRLSIHSFRLKSSAADGHASACKTCMSARDKLRKPRRKVRRLPKEGMKEIIITEDPKIIEAAYRVAAPDGFTVGKDPEDMTAILLNELLLKYNCCSP